MKKTILFLVCFLFAVSLFSFSQSQKRILGDPVDMSLDFHDFHNTFFFADKLASFDPFVAKGKISWKRSTLYTRQAFDVNTILPQDLTMLDFPGAAYQQN
ncbi:MAG TPA: alpha-xylosidase, partial [Paludibacter sp.]|nr:alpha-xylosidase [Paludibacter sp.]